jgi:protocatechuate 3,4-dioxygenase beta subunit
MSTTKRILSMDRPGLNRREALSLLGVTGAGIGLFACGGGSTSTGATTTDGAPPSCIVTPEATEGPFFVDEKLNRDDLVAGETGLGVTSGYPLTVRLTVIGVTGQSCQALPGAYVDIWHANVDGLYSDEPSNFVQSVETTGQTYLRAYQVTDNSGVVTFKTIYPGWYATRTIHIHVKVRLYSATGDKTLEANAQLYFEDTMNDSVLALPAYVARGARSVPKNTNDQVYNGTGPGNGIDSVGLPSGQVPPGDSSVALVSAFNAGSGSIASLSIGVKLS